MSRPKLDRSTSFSAGHGDKIGFMQVQGSSRFELHSLLRPWVRRKDYFWFLLFTSTLGSRNVETIVLFRYLVQPSIIILKCLEQNHGGDW